MCPGSRLCGSVLAAHLTLGAVVAGLEDRRDGAAVRTRGVNGAVGKEGGKVKMPRDLHSGSRSLQIIGGRPGGVGMKSCRLSSEC